ncbi:hypothetical protein CLV42_107200 [Chitinophaga ginsengisoli]|uniref:Uncharacterized protein n=1 Tax=Chitinophaga ginsengisoli TaxID=363837 RepID=A0A2P8G509_9BACT|nr:hypothetical protein CLV42_107200 [Chitinophaga ginsengisoli]
MQINTKYNIVKFLSIIWLIDKTKQASINKMKIG